MAHVSITRLRHLILFQGSDAGGQRAAAIVSPVETAPLDGLGPQACLREVLPCTAEHPIHRIEQLLPRNMAKANELDAQRKAA